MTWFGSWLGATSTGGGGSPVFPVLANATTADLIRDRCITVIEGLIPAHNAADRFRRFRNEEAAAFLAWSEANATSCFRRFQVRDTGDDQPPAVTNTDFAERSVNLTVIVAYPQTSRTGLKNALDRDTAMSYDQHAIENAIGMLGRFNFSQATDPSYPDACWHSGRTSRQRGSAVDFLVIEQAMTFLRQPA